VSYLQSSADYPAAGRYLNQEYAESRVVCRRQYFPEEIYCVGCLRYELQRVAATLERVVPSMT